MTSDHALTDITDDTQELRRAEDGHKMLANERTLF